MFTKLTNMFLHLFFIFLLFQTSDSEDLDLEVSDIEVPDYDLEADFDVPDVDFNVSDI